MYDLYCIPLCDELVIGELKREPKAVIVLCDSEAIRYVKERTCHNRIDKADYTAVDDFQCSECYALMRQNGNAPGGVFNYCPSCGAKVEVEHG